MGEIKETMPQKNFYNVKGHVFRRNVKEKTETSLEEKSKDGEKTYHYEQCKGLQGSFRKFTIWQEDINGQVQDMLAIDLKDTDGNYICLQMFMSSIAADTMLKRFPNVDLTKELTVKIQKQTAKDNKELVFDLITLYQKDHEGKETLLPFFWKKGEDGKIIGSLPETEKKTVNKKKVTDRTARLEFFKKMCDFYNAQITDVVTAIQRDNVSPDDLDKFKEPHSEYGTWINYVPAKTE